METMKEWKNILSDTGVSFNNWWWSKYPWYYVKAMFDIVTKDDKITLWIRPNAWMFNDYNEEDIQWIRFHEHEYKYYDEERPEQYKLIRSKQHAQVVSEK